MQGVHAPAFRLASARAVNGGVARGGTPAGAGAANPHGDLAIACEACHTATAWTPLRDEIDFDHDRQTAFPLAGRHRQADCASCHLDLRFDAPEAAPSDCATCHLDVHRGMLGGDCQTCHGTTDFGLVNGQQIHARTAFPLTGSHLQVSCESCHAGGAGGALGPALGALPTDCMACHADDYAATAATAVDHAAAGFPTDCETCHTTVAFAGQPFDHPTAARGFALVGAHEALPCSACHTSGLEPLFQPASQDDCLTCHAADAAAAPVDHTGFPTTCTQCHTVNAWEGATGDHLVLSGGFPLRGAHTALDCQTCHTGVGTGGGFALPWTPAGPDDCQSCHADDAAAAQPNHAAFPSTCTTCHTDAAWQGATLDHVQVSGGFALVGAHAPLACATCHVNPDFSLPWSPANQDDCLACHADDAAAATPSHDAFPTTCTTCHTVNAWQGATIDHPTVSGGFTLLGAHAAIACQTCHANPDYSLPWSPASQDDCLACHADDAAGATPPHTAFPTTCASCHTVNTWSGATIDHAQVSGGFALVGAHAPLACTTCHVNPDFSLPWSPADQNDCIACHTDDYQDEHAGSGFPTTCLDCHTVNTWGGATVNHPQFPIYSGRHAGEWASCQTCHVQPGDFGVFSCVTCHEHRQSEMDDEHDEVPGYVYESTACYTCHPDGRADDFGLLR